MDDLDRELNDMQDRISRLERLMPSIPSRVPKSGSGGGSGEVRIVTVTAVGDDTLTCDYNGQTMTVNKPYELQRTPFDVALINYLDEDFIVGSVEYDYSSAHSREATISGGDTISERVIPAYIQDGKILVIRIGTEWYDMNVGARAWAEI